MGTQWRTGKLVVVLGPTASGKSALAVKLAKKFNGEVISADSRQVYRGLNIGTGKITKKEMQGIPHYLLDVASPKRRFTPLEIFGNNTTTTHRTTLKLAKHRFLTGFTVTQYRKLALAAIEKIFKKNKLPIICGGSGFYIQAVVDGIVIPEVPPDWKLRKKLEKKSTKELHQMLLKLDPRRAKTIDKNNRRRLIRALEIVIKIKKPVPLPRLRPPGFGGQAYPVLMLGIKLLKKQLREKITKRVEKMMKSGLEKEAKKFPVPVIGYQEWFSSNPKDLIIRHTLQYAKRQMTWFKKDKRIHWVKNYQEVEKLVKEFLGK